jgi:hypothetical protein
MGRPRIQQRDAPFWDSIRSLLGELKISETKNWTQIAFFLGVSKQTLTGFRKKRIPALDAEAVLRLCSRCDLSLTFEGQTISCSNPTLRLTMEFDESFHLEATPKPSITLTRKPPGRVTFIGVRLEQVAGTAQNE